MTSALAGAGGEIYAARLAYRSATADLLFRIDLTHMPLASGVVSPFVYGVTFAVGGARYQVRSAGAGLGTTFTLYREYAGGWSRVQSLPGGYGTVGQAVTFAVPLAGIGAQDGGHLHAVDAFVALAAPMAPQGSPISAIALAP